MQCNSAVAARQPIVFTRGPYIKISGLDFKQRADFKLRLTIPNPAYDVQKRFAGWVGSSLPRYLRGYAEVGENLFVAPGAAIFVWRTLLKDGIRPEYVEPRSSLSEFEWKYDGQTREYQDAVVRVTTHRRSGCIVAPCGAGKTDIGIRIIQRAGMSTLIIVHTKDLLHQWATRIQARLEVIPGLLGGGKKKDVSSSPIVVATVQTLLRNPVVLQSLRERELLIVDECHHTPCSTFTEVIQCLDPIQRYGFTATPERADGTTALMHWWLGETIATVDRNLLEDDGFVMRPRLEVHPLDSLTCTYDVDEPGSYLRVMEALIADEQRFKAIVALVDSCRSDGGHHLVLTGRVEYGDRILAALLERNYPDTAFIHGGLPKTARENILSNAREGIYRVLIATTLADEGLDLPIFDQVHLVTPTRSASKAIQRAGRVCRPLAGKNQPVIHDYVDVNVETVTGGRLFINQFRSRFKAFREFAEYVKSDVNAILHWGRK